jgi:hypothetical protein
VDQVTSSAFAALRLCGVEVGIMVVNDQSRETPIPSLV